MSGTPKSYVHAATEDRVLRLRVRADHDSATRLVAALADEAGVVCELMRGTDVAPDVPDFVDDSEHIELDDEDDWDE